MARNLTRNTRLFISNQSTLGNCDSGNTFEVKVLDGYNFSQATTTEDIEINEAGTTPIRGMKRFNVAQEPPEITMTTYIRPYTNAQSVIDAPERILWAALTGSAITLDVTGNTTGAQVGNGIDQQATEMTIDFEESDSNELAYLTGWFHLENTTYRIDDINISSAEIDFSIDGIAQINWTGMGVSITELSPADHTTIEGWVSATDGSGNYRPVPATTGTSFLRNKLSTLDLHNSDYTNTAVYKVTGTDDTGGSATLVQDLGAFTADALVGDWVYVVELDEARQITANTTDALTVSPAFSANVTLGDTYYVVPGYNIAITGGSLTVENNMSFLTPEELGVVNQPLRGFAGTRSIAGTLTAYLNTGTRGSAGLLNDLLAQINEVSNTYAFELHIGGQITATKRVDVTLATAQISIPTINVEDIIATEITFAGQGSGGVIENKDELVVTYYD